MSGNIIQLNEDLIKNNLKDLVRNSVEETLNALLDHEADELVRAGKYERTGDRKGYRSGHYERNFGTTSGEVRLRVPKLKGIQFETAIIERYKRRECSTEEALIEMYLAGVSVRRVEDITELLWGTKVSSGTISNLNQKAYKHIEEWRQRPLTGEYPYVYVDGIYLKRCWGGEIQNVSVLVDIGVNKDGFREILGAAEGMKEDRESWLNFFTYMDFPTEHWSRIRTNNLTERVNREIRRRTRAIGAFPDGNSALMLVCARLRHVAASEWGSNRYMDMEHLFKMEIEQPNDEENPYI
ncbi:IS256 family transposase [Megasphaera elsdenii]|uniref:IS256 family transposase n=1 Tax=Megasphaera elsdenii TaxID=907 RepID=UPI0040368C81